jgi:hypothetical protein
MNEDKEEANEEGENSDGTKKKKRTIVATRSHPLRKPNMN